MSAGTQVDNSSLTKEDDPFVDMMKWSWDLESEMQNDQQDFKWDTKSRSWSSWSDPSWSSWSYSSNWNEWSDRKEEDTSYDLESDYSSDDNSDMKKYLIPIGIVILTIFFCMWICNKMKGERSSQSDEEQDSSLQREESEALNPAYSSRSHTHASFNLTSSISPQHNSGSTGRNGCQNYNIGASRYPSSRITSNQSHNEPENTFLRRSSPSPTPPPSAPPVPVQDPPCPSSFTAPPPSYEEVMKSAPPPYNKNI